MPCVIPGCDQLGEAHHVKTRGAGGSDKDQIPMCHDHHMEGHTGGWKTFEEKYSINLRVIADVIYQAWKKLGYGGGWGDQKLTSGPN